MTVKFTYTKHADLRAGQREIPKLQIETTILQPDRILPSFKGRSLAQKKFRRRTLEVVYRRDNGEAIIITAYWLKEVR